MTASGWPYLVNQDFGGKVLEVFERLDASNFSFTRFKSFMTSAYISGRNSRLYYYESGFILNRADKATSPRKALAGTPQETRDITALVFFLISVSE